MQGKTMKNRLLKICASIFVIAAVFGGVFVYHHTHANGFKDYSAVRDKQFLHKMFDDNLYWLYAGEPGGFSLDSFLETRKLTHGLGTYDVTMKMYVVGNKPVGFVAYYMKTFVKGILLFLVVDQEQRGHRYGEKLLKYACDEMFNKGARVVQLLTRTNNTSALALYKRAGFKEFWQEEGFVQLELTRK